MTRSIQSIFVTGASTGIGRASALALDRAGFRVFAGIRNETAGDALRADASDRLEPVVCDVTRDEDVSAARQRVSTVVGHAGLAGLMNNAGIAVNGPLEFVPISEVRRQLEVNVVGQLTVTRAFLGLLRKGRGRIVLTGSTSGFLTPPLMGPYCMSKHAIEAMADALRLELRPWGMHVALLQPGVIETPIWEKALREGDAFVRDGPPQLRQLYGPLLDRTRKLAIELAARADPPEIVARAAVHAFTSRRPKARYLMGKNSYLERMVSRLPGSLRDHLLATTLGIKRGE